MIAGATLLAGAGLGGACGYAAGAHVATEAASVPTDDLPSQWMKPTGDSQLDELRRLAVQAPDHELFSKALTFLDLLREHYSTDAALWHGAERIGKGILNDQKFQSRRGLAKWLCQVIRRNDPTMSPLLQKLLPELEKVQ